MTALTGGLYLHQEYGPGSGPWAWYSARTVSATHTLAATWRVDDAAAVAEWGPVQRRQEDADGDVGWAVGWDDGSAGLALHRKGGGRLAVNVCGEDLDALRERVRELRELVPVAEDPPEGEVHVSFWSLSNHGPSQIIRKLDVPRWDDVSDNYPAQTAAGLRALMGFRPSSGGQLLLWHGVPGTGKTWALRALASEWRDWAEVHYITDPEAFFAHSAHYMLQVLLSPSDSPTPYDPDRRGEPEEEKWRLLVFEDTGELLSADARERSGQGLARFLNVVDGLIGQGLRVLALVTTNEELRNIHPAVSRPGRCAAQVKFHAFPGGQAHEWLVANGVENPGRPTATLAELYAITHGQEAAERGAVGFA